MSDETKMSLEEQRAENREDPVLPRYGYYQTPTHSEKKDYRNPTSESVHKSSGFGRHMLEVVVLAIVFGVVSSAAFQIVNRMGGMIDGQNTEEMVTPNTETVSSVETDSSETSAVQTQESTDKGRVAAVVQAAMPSIVAITTVSVQEISDWFGGTYQYQSAGSGSGILVGENDTELLVATNNHVVSGASTLSILFYGTDVTSAEGSQEAVSGIVKGTSEDLDLAVVAVKKEDLSQEILENIKIATLGDSEQLAVGEQVVAIGNALGYGQSVTVGYISALNRTVSTSDGMVSNLLQTDAAINPGNSGGALLDMNGRLIGINSAKYADEMVEGIGYAIPITQAMPILEELMDRQTREKLEDSESSYLGVHMRDFSSDLRRMYQVPTGAYVYEVVAGSPAEQYGIRARDIIHMMDGQTIQNSEELLEKLQYYAPGETVEIVVYRGMNGAYVEQAIMVVLGEK